MTTAEVYTVVGAGGAVVGAAVGCGVVSTGAEVMVDTPEVMVTNVVVSMPVTV